MEHGIWCENVSIKSMSIKLSQSFFSAFAQGEIFICKVIAHDFGANTALVLAFASSQVELYGVLWILYKRTGQN